MRAPPACNGQSVKVYFYEDKETNTALGELIPENEKIILFIAIGHYKNEIMYATFHRMKIEEVFIDE